VTFFSVIIPTYNRAHFLDDTILSVLNQKFVDFELLIVDDGSTDNTQKVVERYIQQDDRVNYIYQKNQERAVARNNGIQQAKGKYAVFLDSDDQFLPNHLEVLHHHISQNDTICFFATKYYIQNGDRTWYDPDLKSKKIALYDYKTFLKANFLCCHLCVSLGNDELVLFNEDKELTRCEDWYFLIQNTSQKPLLLIDEVSVCMIDHPERSMNKDHQTTINSRLRLTKLLKENVLTSASEIRYMEGYSYYFCAVFARLDRKSRQAFFYLVQSIRRLGFTKKIILLFLKIIFK